MEQQLSTAPAEKAHVCRRCGGKGEFNCYRHVKAGVCFRCWGTKLDLPSIEQELARKVIQLRAEYRRAVQRRASQGQLADIVRRGKRAAKALELQRADTAALASNHRN